MVGEVVPALGLTLDQLYRIERAMWKLPGLMHWCVLSQHSWAKDIYLEQYGHSEPPLFVHATADFNGREMCVIAPIEPDLLDDPDLEQILPEWIHLSMERHAWEEVT